MSFSTLSQFDFHQVIESTPGVSLVLFTSPGCGACHVLKRALQSPGFAAFHLFEVDAGDDLALTREFDVFHLPALFLFKDGRFHRELTSEPEPSRLRAAVEEALSGPAEEAP